MRVPFPLPPLFPACPLDEAADALPPLAVGPSVPSPGAAIVIYRLRSYGLSVSVWSGRDERQDSSPKITRSKLPWSGYDVFGPKGGTQRNQNLWIPNVQIYMCCATCRAGESSNSHSGGRQQRKRYGDTPPVIYWRAVFSVFSRMAVFPSFPDDEQTIERERENIATYYYTVVRSTSYVASYVVESRYMLHTCNGCALPLDRLP